jgi:hypothetical protein
MELLLIVGALVALFIAYRHGKLAGVASTLKSLQPKVAAEAAILEPKAKSFVAKLSDAFKRERPVLEGEAKTVYAELLKEVQAIRSDVNNLKNGPAKS